MASLVSLLLSGSLLGTLWIAQLPGLPGQSVIPTSATLYLSAARIERGSLSTPVALEVQNPTQTVWKISHNPEFVLDTEGKPGTESRDPQNALLRPVIRFLLPRTMKRPEAAFETPDDLTVTEVAPGGSALLKLNVPTNFLPEGRIRIQAQLWERERLVAESPAQELIVYTRPIREHIPTPQEIAALFRFRPQLALTMQTPPPMAQTGGKARWTRLYENKVASEYSISVILLDRGSYLTAARQRELETLIQRGRKEWPGVAGRNPYFTFRTRDNRTGYNYALAGLGGSIEFTIVPTRDRQGELLIVLDMDIDVRKRLPKTARPTRNASEVIEALETMLTPKPARQNK